MTRHCAFLQGVLFTTARFEADETRTAGFNGHRNPEWWRDFSQLQPETQNLNLNLDRKIRYLGIQSNQNLRSILYREIPTNLIISILNS